MLNRKSAAALYFNLAKSLNKISFAKSLIVKRVHFRLTKYGWDHFIWIFTLKIFFGILLISQIHIWIFMRKIGQNQISGILAQKFKKVNIASITITMLLLNFFGTKIQIFTKIYLAWKFKWNDFTHILSIWNQLFLWSKNNEWNSWRGFLLPR